MPNGNGSSGHTETVGGGTGNGRGGGFLGGFAQPGVRETKAFTPATEVSIPLQQGGSIFLLNLLTTFGAYITLKLFIVSRADWSLFVGIVTTLFIIGLAAIAAGRFRLPDDRRELFIIVGIASIVSFFVLQFYIDVIVPQMTFTLDQQAHITFVVCCGIAFVQARFHTVNYFITELENSLLNSDSHSFIEWIKLQWDREKYYNEHPPRVVEALPEPTNPVLVSVAPRSRIPMSSEERFRRSVVDFLAGIANAEWDETEETWSRQPLPTSELILTKSRGREIRDLLIKSGWASWKDPNKHGVGWKLEYPISQIIEGFTTFKNGGDGNGEEQNTEPDENATPDVSTASGGV